MVVLLYLVPPPWMTSLRKKKTSSLILPFPPFPSYRLTQAALGNIISNVVGITSGNTVETKLNKILPDPKLSISQVGAVQSSTYFYSFPSFFFLSFFRFIMYLTSPTSPPRSLSLSLYFVLLSLNSLPPFY